MTKDDIARMARESGGLPDPMVFIAAYERFANLVAAAALEQPEQEPVAWIFTPNNDLLWPAEVEAKNPIALNSYQPLYTTPPAAKQPRPWVGLTDEDVNRESAMIPLKMKLAFHAGMYVAQNILKERNT
jgi:hypothetical protein